MADREIGFIELSGTTRIVFSVGTWKGQPRGSFRKFVASERYTGPTKSGFSLTGTMLVHLLQPLRSLQATIPAHGDAVFATVGKTSQSEIRITIIPQDTASGLPNVDIREFLNAPGYTGPTKKGVRFSWDKLRHFIQLLETVRHELGAAVTNERTLFPEVQPAWIKDAEAPKPPATGAAPAAPSLDPAQLKAFPAAFLPCGSLESRQLTLPAEPLSNSQDPEGRYFVANISGFRHAVRNEIEGKFLIYAQNRGQKEIQLPKEMFKVFSTVTGYEKYCRELRQKLVHDLELRCRNRQLAEYQARDILQSRGLPIC
jgi:hypothetical protein